VTLQEGADEEDIKATYDKGILTVSVGVAEQGAATEKHIVVHTASRARFPAASQPVSRDCAAAPYSNWPCGRCS
jgi:Hsp20/alpha crystallin family